MTALQPITDVGDTWINSDADRQGQRYGDTNEVRIQAGDTKRGLLKPQLPNIAGETVVDAYLVGHGAAALAAQQLLAVPIIERWQPGRATWVNPQDGGPDVNLFGGAAVTIGATPADTPVTIPNLGPMLQAVADGTEWHGIRLTTDYTTSPQRFRSTDSGYPAWELHIVLSEVAETPGGLRPDGGTIGTTTPVLAWDPIEDQAESRVQVDTPAVGVDPDEVTPDYDSGWETNSSSQWALAGEHTLVGAGPHYWRVQVEGSDGGDPSEWSDWAEINYAALPTIIMDSPTGPFGDPTPRILAHLSSGTISHWKAIVTGPDRGDVRARTGVQTGPIDWTIPMYEKRGLTSFIVGGGGANQTRPRRKVLREGQQSWLNLRVWDTVDRVPGVDDPPAADLWVLLEFGDAALTAPANFSVSSLNDGTPRRVWSWEYAEAADAWLIQIDEVTVVRLEPDDVTLVAGVYTWTDHGHVAPLRPQVLGVRAVEGNERSPAASIEIRPDAVEGVWVIPHDTTIAPMVFDGTAVSNWSRTDYRATYKTSEGDEVDVLYGTPPRTGTFEGSVDSRLDDVWATLTALDQLRDASSRLAQVVWGSRSATAWIRDPDHTPHDDIDNTNLLHVVRFGFTEVD